MNQDFSWEAFVKERDTALLSLDKPTIEAYALNNGIVMPDDDEAFWITVHKARCEIANFPEEVKECSRQWLVDRGYYPGFDLKDPTEEAAEYRDL